jgi:hypothetical protein
VESVRALLAVVPAVGPAGVPASADAASGAHVVRATAAIVAVGDMDYPNYG